MKIRIPRRANSKIFTLAVITLLGAAACSSAPAASNSSSNNTEPTHNGVVHLTFWTWVTDMQPQIDLFNKTHKNVQVSLNIIPAANDGGYQKMFSAVKAGNAPCLAQVGYQDIPEFLVANALENIKQYAEPYKDQFVPWQWQQGVFNGGVYDVPWAGGPMGFFYRADLFAKDGITRPPATWDEFAKDAAIIHQKNPNQYINDFELANGGAGLLTSLAWQAGAQWFGTKGNTWTVNIDSPETRKVAAYWNGLVQKNLVKTDGWGDTVWNKDLQDGNIMGMVGPDWLDSVFEANAPATAGKWRVANLPQWAGSSQFRSANDGGSSVAVLRGCTYPREATEFAAWLGANPQSADLTLTLGNGWPAIRDVSQVSALKDAPSVFKFYGGQNIYNTFSYADENINESWKWIPTINSTDAQLGNGLSGAVTGHGSFTGAVAATQQATMAALKAEGIQASAG